MSTTRDQIDAESRKDPERLEREIDQQRDIIGSIVSALENKLSPSEIVDRVMRASKDNGGDFARNLGNVVRANPMPTLLASAGLVWLYASRHDTAPVHDPERSRDHAYSGSGASATSPMYEAGNEGAGGGIGDKASHIREGISERASHLREGASHLRESASHRLSDTRERIGETAHHAADSMRHQAGRARQGFSHMMEDNPLVIGAIAIGIGALLGAALPVTRKEDELMGETGDKLRSKASEAGHTVREKGREVAQSVREKGRETAHEIKDSARTGTGSTAGPDYSGTSSSSAATSTGATTTGCSGPTSTQGSGDSPRSVI